MGRHAPRRQGVEVGGGVAPHPAGVRDRRRITLWYSIMRWLAISLMGVLTVNCSRWVNGLTVEMAVAVLLAMEVVMRPWGCTLRKEVVMSPWERTLGKEVVVRPWGCPLGQVDYSGIPRDRHR